MCGRYMNLTTLKKLEFSSKNTERNSSISAIWREKNIPIFLSRNFTNSGKSLSLLGIQNYSGLVSVPSEVFYTGVRFWRLKPRACLVVEFLPSKLISDLLPGLASPFLGKSDLLRFNIFFKLRVAYRELLREN